MEPKAERIREIVEHQSMERRSLSRMPEHSPRPLTTRRRMASHELDITIEELRQAIERFVWENPGKLVKLREVSR